MRDLKYDVGDRVVIVRQPEDLSGNRLLPGSAGTIAEVYCSDEESSFDYAVEWDECFRGGYRIDNKTSHGHGWKVFESDITLEDKDTDVAVISVEDLNRLIPVGV